MLIPIMRLLSAQVSKDIHFMHDLSIFVKKIHSTYLLPKQQGGRVNALFVWVAPLVVDTKNPLILCQGCSYSLRESPR